VVHPDAPQAAGHGDASEIRPVAGGAAGGRVEDLGRAGAALAPKLRDHAGLRPAVQKFIR
jgi:hypothetical protein